MNDWRCCISSRRLGRAIHRRRGLFLENQKRVCFVIIKDRLPRALMEKPGPTRLTGEKWGGVFIVDLSSPPVSGETAWRAFDFTLRTIQFAVGPRDWVKRSCELFAIYILPVSFLPANQKCQWKFTCVECAGITQTPVNTYSQDNFCQFSCTCIFLPVTLCQCLFCLWAWNTGVILPV